MNSKLTAAQAMKYYGFQVKIIDSPRTATIRDIMDGMLWFDGIWSHVSQCQLLLTPLSAITDEHAIEVADIINLHYPFSEPLRFDCGLVKMGYQLQPNKSSSLYNYDVIDLLRSLGYDCDNAISEGWAVDKTTFDNK